MDFEEFLAVRLAALLRFAVAVTGDQHRADDVVQDVLVKAARRWRRIQGMDAPEAYVKRMIVNQHLSWRRRRRETPVSAEVLTALGGGAGDPAAVHEGMAELQARIEGLPARQRVALALRYYEDLSYPDIARFLGCSEGTVRSHVSRALATLRVELVEEGAR
ncbi:SigE family RNA polymerase sigma factor [Actinocorallia longicatena]|uniref:SigE family RNA polymerase sigma factor n=1 Tax=Actinocorallia longicatena TaxID=111803 RepID=A0ABP6QG47_9ACTN